MTGRICGVKPAEVAGTSELFRAQNVAMNRYGDSGFGLSQAESQTVKVLEAHCFVPENWILDSLEVEDETFAFAYRAEPQEGSSPCPVQQLRRGSYPDFSGFRAPAKENKAANRFIPDWDGTAMGPVSIEDTGATTAAELAQVFLGDQVGRITTFV